MKPYALVLMSVIAICGGCEDGPDDDAVAARNDPVLGSPELDAVAAYEFDASRYSTLDIPLLLLLGSDSPPVLRGVSDALAAVVPNVRMTVLAGQQHAANYDAPELFAAAVTKFLDQVQESQ